jgi:DNA-binding transcriptional LysR family regulator
MKGIEITPLRCLEAAVRLGSLTAASRALHISQPAVTVQIASLERRLGARLLHRDSRGVEPTAAGLEALKRIRRILDDVASLEGGMETGPIRGQLRIGSTDVVVLHRLPPVLRSFRDRHPEVELQLMTEGSQRLAQGVRAREVEMGLVTLPIPDPPGPVRPLYRDRLCFCVAARHPLAGRKRLRLEDVAEQPLLAHKAGSVTRSLVEGTFSARGLVPRIAMEISSPEVLRRMARSGLGIAVLPEISIREEVRRGQLVVLPVTGWTLDRVSGLLLPPGGPPSRGGREFLKILMDRHRRAVSQ